MGFKPWRVFLDTSALLAGLISSKGAAREVLSGGEMRVFEILVSSQVLLEADRNIEKKFPRLLMEYRDYMRSCEPTLVADPTPAQVKAAVPMVGEDDAPILAAALQSGAQFLITWNTRHFMTPKVPKDLPVQILNPGEFIEEWMRFLRESAPS